MLLSAQAPGPGQEPPHEPSPPARASPASRGAVPQRGASWPRRLRVVRSRARAAHSPYARTVQTATSRCRHRFRSDRRDGGARRLSYEPPLQLPRRHRVLRQAASAAYVGRSEEHTSELQSRQYLVCRLLLEKKNNPVLHVTSYFIHISR